MATSAAHVATMPPVASEAGVPNAGVHHDKAKALGDKSGVVVAVAEDRVVASAQGRQANTPPLGVSASVGHDHWASDVMKEVHRRPEDDATATTASTTETSSPTPPPPPPPPPSLPASESHVVPPPADDSHLDPVAKLVLEKKRKFHSGRMLEVKNLPDECTEQVRNSGINQAYHYYVSCIPPFLSVSAV